MNHGQTCNSRGQRANRLQHYEHPNICVKLLRLRNKTADKHRLTGRNAGDNTSQNRIVSHLLDRHASAIAYAGRQINVLQQNDGSDFAKIQHMRWHSARVSGVNGFVADIPQKTATVVVTNRVAAEVCDRYWSVPGQ